MSDTKPHAQSSDPVEHDAVSYSGIGWFIVILTGTTLVCQLIVWGLFEFAEYRVTRSEAPRAATAAPATSPLVERGQLVSGAESTPRPALLVDEPTVLGEVRRRQREAETTYGWINQAAGTIRLPIDRAQQLVLERGLPVRQDPAATPAPDVAAGPGQP